MRQIVSTRQILARRGSARRNMERIKTRLWSTWRAACAPADSTLSAPQRMAVGGRRGRAEEGWRESACGE